MDEDNSIKNLIGFIVFVIAIILISIIAIKNCSNPEIIYTITTDSNQIEYSSMDGYSVILNQYGVCYIYKDGILQKQISDNVSLSQKVN